METRFNSCELVRQRDDSHLQTIVGRPGAAGFGHVYVHQIGRDQEGFTQFYQKLDSATFTFIKSAAIRKDLLSSIRN